MLAMPACRGEPQPSGLGVVATVAPLGFLAQALGGERLHVSTLVPRGATPHAFAPRPSDVARLAEARTLLRVGGGLDAWTQALLGAAPSGVAIWTASDVPGALDPTHPGDVPDPHVWLDPIRVRDRLAPSLARHLARLDPGAEARYQARLEELRRRVSRLDRELAALFAQRGRLRYVALHPGWSHLAHRYQLEEVGVVHGPALEEPTPRALARLIDAARRSRPHALVAEPQLPPRLATLLARELGTRLVVADPLGSLDAPGPSSYEALMRAAAQAFVTTGLETP